MLIDDLHQPLISVSLAVWILGVVGWFLIRLPHQRRSKRSKIAKTSRSRAEMISLWISGSGFGLFPVLAIFTNWISFTDRDQNWLLVMIGFACFLFALYLFRRTHKALGRNWSVSLDIREDHRLVTDGIYAFARHPMYSAFWLWAIAQFFLLPNWIAGIAGIIGFGQLYFQRVPVEEKMMREEFGEEYEEYSKNTGRLTPKIL